MAEKKIYFSSLVEEERKESMIIPGSMKTIISEVYSKPSISPPIGMEAWPKGLYLLLKHDDETVFTQLCVEPNLIGRMLQEFKVKNVDELVNKEVIPYMFKDRIIGFTTP